jgi:hypothetical protein
MSELYLVKGFNQQNAVFADFLAKSKSFHLFVGVLCVFRLGVIYDSQATNRSAAGGRGVSHRESSLLPIGRLGVIYDTQPHGFTLFL